MLTWKEEQRIILMRTGSRFVPFIYTICLRPKENENAVKQKYLQIMQKQGALPIQRSYVCVCKDE